MRQKYHKQFTQEEATAMVKSTRSAGQHHRASLAWTPPPIFHADPSGASTSTDSPRQSDLSETAMQALTVSDGMPHVNNLW